MRWRGRSLAVVGLIGLAASALAGIPAAPVAAAPTSITRASVDTGGGDADLASHDPSASADGRYVAFDSAATDLVGGDGNGLTDVFVRDTVAGTTTRVSVDTGGGDPDGYSESPVVSADGRYVAFESAATDLVGGDGNGETDVFVRDTVAGTTTRVSVDTGGDDPNEPSHEPAISADGRYVAFRSAASDLVAGDTNGQSDVFLRDTVAGTTSRASIAGGGGEGDGPSRQASVSADGRYVAFRSGATDLVAGDTNGENDVFLRDTVAGTTERLSTDTSGADSDGASQVPEISADGRFVAFGSSATDLVAGDTNGAVDTFVRDTVTDSTARVSLDTSGGNADGSSARPRLSADGSTVVFDSEATDLVASDGNGAADVFAFDLSIFFPPLGDTTPPTITLTTPPHGAVYSVGQAVNAGYSCADAGSGVATCSGTVANGAAIDTASAGIKTFTVTATDNAGNPSTLEHTYRVIAGPVQQDFSGGTHGPNRIPVDCDTLFGAFDESIPVDSPAVNLGPTQVQAGGTFTWEMRISEDEIPTLNNGSNGLYRFRAPSNATFVSATFVDGGEHVIGSTIQVVGGKLELRIPTIEDSSFLGFGADPFRPPRFRATLQATGPVGSQVTTDLEYYEITTTLGGTSHCPTPDPPDPNPTLLTTTIVDSTPPTATLTTPVDGAVYDLGEAVTADYACGDETALASCVGTVADGAAVDTSTAGTFQFQVTGTDTAGNTTKQWATYTVRPPIATVADTGATEGFDPTITFQVSLSGPSSQAVDVDWETVDGTAVAGSDYTADSGTVHFLAGETTKPVSVALVDDGIDEGPSETMGIELSNPTNADLALGVGATGTILDDDNLPVIASAGDVTIDEGDGGVVQKAKLTVNLSKPPTTQVTVKYSTVAGTASAGADFKAKTNKTLKFKPGKTTKSVAIVVKGDTDNEGDETFDVVLSSPSGAVIGDGTGVVTIRDDDDPTSGSVDVRVGDALVHETHFAKTKVFVPVTLNQPSASTVTVKFSSVAGTASPGSDYKTKSNKTLKFKPGKTTKWATFIVYGDLDVEGDETFDVTLSSPVNATITDGTGTVTIADDD